MQGFALNLAQNLIREESVTPAAAQTFEIIENALSAHRFTVHRQCFGDVENLFAYRTSSANPFHLMFLGHVDVVPPGDISAWTHPPFGGEVNNNTLYGRGAADMKGAIAAFIAALQNAPSTGTISILLTSDEEGPATHGTKKMIPWLQKNMPHLFPPTLCLVGEPSSQRAAGDTLKIGRRGSITGTLRFQGTPGHIAYPNQGENPIPRLFSFFQKAQEHLFTATHPQSPNTDSNPSLPFSENRRSNVFYLDHGNEHFDPSHLAITHLSSEPCASNVTPAWAQASFGIRFNTSHQGNVLIAHLQQRAKGYGAHTLDLTLHGSPYLTTDQGLIRRVQDSVQQITGKCPALSTSGGTSDGRFMANFCPVIELGLCSKTIHKIDECIALEDLEALTHIYHTLVTNLA